ncbi:MAG: dihydroxyacetone kinase phosphoryl donor subunit DhaM, partial [Actinomycetota bacterium]
MVGIVIVSHSALISRGVSQLARAMGGSGVCIEAVGGLNEADDSLGTDACSIFGAIERIRGDGVLVLMDIGSSVLSAECALEMLAPERRKEVLLCDAPLVEGAVAAAVAARLGETLERVAEQARRGLHPKAEQLGETLDTGQAITEPGPPAGRPGGEELTLRFVVSNPLGLHARPVARLIHAVAGFDAEIDIANVTAGRGPAPARSFSGVFGLGAGEGHEILVTARGADASRALSALTELARRGFGDPDPTPSPPLQPPERTEKARDRRLTVGPETPCMTGLGASPGIAFGAVRVLRSPALDTPDHPSDDADGEWKKLTASLGAVQREIEAARAALIAGGREEESGILDAHLLILSDEQILRAVRGLIFEGGAGAPRSWNLVMERVVAAHRGMEVAYLRSRAEDIAGLARRVLEHLVGAASTRVLSGSGIVVASTLAPDQILALDLSLIQGIATAHGGPTSHSAILARSLGVPAVVGLGEAIFELGEGTPILIDGNRGLAYPDPARELVEGYRTRTRHREDGVLQSQRRSLEPAVTTDGQRIRVLANIGSLQELSSVLAAGAEGVGLLRTEFLFLGRESLPTEEEQEAVYLQVAEALEGRPLVLRTFDLGGDKQARALSTSSESNPALGLRGIRLALARPAVLATQLRAALKVGSRFPLRITFPMVASLDEYRSARAILEREKEALGGAGMRFSAGIGVGVMVEI